jgi:hypothetical protein
MNIRLLLVFVCAPASVLADVEMKFSDGSNMLVSGGRVLFGESGNSVLFEPGREGLIVLNAAEKTFMEMKPGFADDVAEQMEKMLADLPPEQRAMVEQQMPDVRERMKAARPQFEVKHTGKEDEVAGFDCSEAEIVDGDGNAKEIVCIASPDDLGISGKDFRALAAFMTKLAEIAAMAPDEDSFIDLDALGGVPVRSEHVDYGRQSELISISTSGLDASRLEIPDDYTEVSMEAMMNR